MTTLVSSRRPAAPTSATSRHVASGALGMAFVGGSVAVSGALAGGPLLTAQSLRYAVASLLLVLAARRTGRRVLAPRGTEWLLLAGVTGLGLVVFNLALVHGAGHAEPAVLGVAVACVPVLLAVVGPVLEGRRPAARAMVAALVVTAGAAVVQGLGRSDATGLLLAVLVFVCEAGFTLLAVPLLATLGPYSVSVHTTWLAAAVFGVLGVLDEGAAAVTRLDGADLVATAYLAVCVTALAFVLWYSCVHGIGAARAGLLTGVAPVVAAATGVALGGPVPGPGVWLGVLVVGSGIVLGMRRSVPCPTSDPPSGPTSSRCRTGTPRSG